jgi:hypothetical protein
VKRFVSALLLLGGLLVAGGANATPVTWTIPPTTLSGSGNSISGTFVYDADTNTTSSINLSSTIGGTTTPLTYPGSNTGGYVRFQASAVAVVPINQSPGTTGAFLPSTGLTNAGGSVTIAAFLGNGECATVSAGLCTNFNPAGFEYFTSDNYKYPSPSSSPIA